MPNSNVVSLDPATGAFLAIPGKRPVNILPKRGDLYFSQYPSNEHKQPNELAGNMSSINPLTVQDHTQASGVGISSDQMRISNMETLSGFASNRSQEQPLPTNGAPIDTLSIPLYHTHTIPSIQHLFRDLDASRGMESTTQPKERDTLLGGDSRMDAAG